MMIPLYENMDVSVFERMSLAAAKHDATNLGQGFPDFGWPEHVVDAAARHLAQSSNQYPPSRGLPVLREAIAGHYRAAHGIDVTADHVTVTSGATEALAALIFATVKPGDEVIVFTPAYDAYVPMIRRAGGIPVEVRLEGPDFRIDAEALGQKCRSSTTAIVLTNPHNPTGRLFGRAELEALASVAIERDLMVISDEVWEHVLLDGQDFTPLAAIPGMAERTLKCGSAGKIFSLTGWKIGWIVAPPALAATAAKAHQFLTFASPPNLQAAVAEGLGDPSWIPDMRRAFAASRDRLLTGLNDAGFVSVRPEATYFMVVDLTASGLSMDDEAFAKLAVEQAAVAVVPMSPFYIDDARTNLVRLCFAKVDGTIDAGLKGMAKARGLARS